MSLVDPARAATLMTYLSAHSIPWTDLTDDERDGCQLVLGTVPADFDRSTTRIG